MVLCLPVAPAARSPGAQMRGKADSTRLARMDWEGPVPAQGVEAYSVVRKHVTRRQAGICSPASRRPPGAHCEPVWEAHCAAPLPAPGPWPKAGAPECGFWFYGSGGARWEGLRAGGLGPCRVWF